MLFSSAEVKMSGSINKVMLIGNLGNDPEVRNFPNGGKVCNFNVATSERWKDRNTGEQRERTEWHRIAIFNENLVRLAEQYLKKGSKVFVEGKLETRKWQDNSGQEKFTTEVVLRPYNGELTFLDRREGYENSSDAPARVQNSQSQGTHTPDSNTSTHSQFDDASDFSNDIDDEIPF